MSDGTTTCMVCLTCTTIIATGFMNSLQQLSQMRTGALVVQVLYRSACIFDVISAYLLHTEPNRSKVHVLKQ